MELDDVLHSTASVREFSGDFLPDETLFKILDKARFAPSGGNRQGWRVIIVRRPKTREALAELITPATKRYIAQLKVGENPWNTITPTTVTAEDIEQTSVPAMTSAPFLLAAVVLVVCVDLKVVAVTDQDLERVSVVGGASIYPFTWNILLAARQEGYGGTITTLAVAQEAALKDLLNIPPDLAVCALLPLGKPVKQVTKLKRNPVPSFAMLEEWGGEPFTGQHED